VEHGQFFSDQLPPRLLGRGGVSDEVMAAFAKQLSSDDWRQWCLKGPDGGGPRGTFSVIVTYLAQLMAHDVTLSARLDTRTLGGTGHDTATRETGLPNLRATPLMFETIYGEGLHHDPQLFSRVGPRQRSTAETFALSEFMSLNERRKIELPPFALAVPGPAQRPAFHPMLGDGRNADNTILMLMANEFMRFHNRIVAALVPLPGQSKDARKARARRFNTARALVTATWHRIIEHEILGNTTMPQPVVDVPMSPMARSVDVVHGVMRAFHALPLSDYVIKGEKKETLAGLLSLDGIRPPVVCADGKIDFSTSLDTWTGQWFINWEVLATNQTAFTPSFAQGFGIPSILRRDADAALLQKVSPIHKYPQLVDATKAFRSSLSKFLGCDGKHELGFDPKRMPLVIGFLAEAFVSGRKGGTLGPLGSKLLQQEILGNEGTLTNARARLAEARTNDKVFQRWSHRMPSSFLRMIDFQPEFTQEEELLV